MICSVFICGASVRAAAFSALRAGYAPWCADLFADADLQVCCPTLRIPSAQYPAGFIETAKNWAPPGPWLYTGGMENRPEIVDEISRHRPLWGNKAAVLKRVRDPFVVSEALQSAGLAVPEVRRRPDGLPADGTWLVKPLHGSGGSGIHPWHGVAESRRLSPATHYYQATIDGQACAAVYLADGETASLIGVTRQLVGETWLHARPFAYCGSIGPMQLSVHEDAEFRRLGNVLAQAFRLQGLFGVDCILKDGVPWPVEVNPRYTASVEVLEYVLEIATLRAYSQSCSQAQPGNTLSSRLRLSSVGLAEASNEAEPQRQHVPRLSLGTRGLFGKAILFAKDGLVFPQDGPWMDTLRKSAAIHGTPDFADIPHAGSRIEAGSPILTFFACGSDEADCLGALRRRAGDLDRRLFGR